MTCVIRIYNNKVVIILYALILFTVYLTMSVTQFMDYEMVGW